MGKKLFSENLKYYRKFKGMTQKQLALDTGVTQVAIANYEGGNRFPSEEQLRNISQSLRVSLDNLMSIHFQEEKSGQKGMGNLDEFFKIVQKESTLRSREYLNQWRDEENLSLSDLFHKVIIPLLIETGELWRQGAITAAEEHIISERVRELIYVSCLNYTQNHKRDYSPVWLGLCAPGEDHDLALLMNACLLREAGWQVINLGTNIPMADLKKVIETLKVDVVNFSITRPIHINGLRTALEVLQAEFSNKIKVIVSGSGADKSLQNELEIVRYVCSTLAESVSMAESCIEN
ncbi:MULTISPECIES: cobalamin-dependent protein [unclassified Oceanispirochaeta]|uniref:cobalamin-dependent protein n=1 Tax=unclassified Oceanispirochaeta TaxID=2635722 RepID=UPI000E09C5E5|nr:MULTISPECIES: cobalamin-dependent protein [unclassified Oceanispirochaeta]MBF9014330.1 cobalamin-dependent protein [Oceanispirochaeta sp. M2]NPD71216.1 helix-turn-helix domain-containing protein [Oceanispirochaeta sp. M1]RDG33603.1 helix-turn-helix domain-containing protein [Oceanispirochaeta sp. M1]